MQSLLSFHWMPWHSATKAEDVFKRFNPKWIKLVRPEGDKAPFIDVAMRHAEHVLLRSYVVSENWMRRGAIGTPEKAIAVGNNIANAYKQILGWSQHEFGFTETQMGKIVVEVALNEPHVWTDGENSAMTALCTKTAVDNLTASGIRCAAGNWGVSWEGNHDTKEHPHPGAIPDWSAYYDLFKSVKRNGGWLSLHEYCDYLESKDENGNTIYGYKRNWGWWGGHLYSLLPYFNHVGFDLPILVTEAGIDNYVNEYLADVPRGWHSLINSGNGLPEAAARYVDILGWYDQQLLQFPDGLVEAIFPYTFDIQNKEWESFDVFYAEFLDRLKGHMDWIAARTVNDLEPPVVPVYDTNVPWYPTEEPEPPEPPTPPIESKYPPKGKIVSARWQSEQATREMESLLKRLNDLEKQVSVLELAIHMAIDDATTARQRLADNVTPVLYDCENAAGEEEQNG